MSRDSWRFHCPACRREYPLDRPRAFCDCGGCLDLPTPAGEIDPDRVGSEAGWTGVVPRGRGGARIDLGERATPLLEAELDGRRFRFKVESTLPTGSFKDRGYRLLVSHLLAWGVREVAGDSSGNAACSLAAYCARAGIRAVLFVPAAISAGKRRLLEAYGADLRPVAAGRSAARREALAHGRRTFYAGHATHPLFLHGVKTIAYEIWEQLGGAAPGAVWLPVGNGTLLLGVHLGFRELLGSGRIRREPRLIGVQAEVCAPLASAFAGGAEEPAAVPARPTAAEGIAIPEPPRGAAVLRAVRETGGEILAVSETEILEAQARLGRAGILVEPTAAAGFAALRRSAPPTAGDAEVAVLTGSGIKTLPGQ